MVFLSDAHNIERPAKRRPFLDLYQTDLVSGLSQRAFPRRVESDDALDGEIEAFSTSRSTRRVAAVTHAANLIPQDTNEVSDVVLRDLSSDTVFCLSCGPDGAVGSDSSGNPILSSDGRWVLFESQATNLIQLADTNRVRDVFLRDIESGTTTVVSSTGDRGLFNSPSRAMAISPDGNLVVFRSESTNPPAPAGISSDLWLRWRSRGVVQRVGFDAQGSQVVRTVLGLALSENGRGLVCRVSGATNAIWSIDVDTGAPTLISSNLLSGRTKTLQPYVSIDLIPPDARAVSITADGKRIAFLGIPKGTEEVRAYLWSAIGGLRDAMAPGDPTQLQGLELSPDGEALAFLTAEAVPKAGAPVGGVARWYVRNLTSGQTRPLGLASSGTLSREAPVFHPRGDSVVFQSAGRFPEVPDDNWTDDVFRASFDTDQLELVSRRGPELPLVSGSGPSTLAPGALSHDGRFVAFVSLADNLVPGDSNGRRDVFVRDLLLGTNALVSVGLDGRSPAGDSWEARLSAQGRHVVFVSTATNLVAGDTNPVSAIYVRDLATGTTLLASARDQGDQKGEGSAFNHQISANGEWVTFESPATNLVSGVTNSAHRLYLRHVPSQRTVLVSGGLSPSSRAESSGSFGAVMDGVGSRVVFLSRDDAYLYSVSAGTSQMLTTGIRAATLSLSQDGSRLALLGNLTNSPSLRAVYWRDLSTTTNRLIAAAPSTTQNRFGNVSLSGGGRRVVFESDFVAPASTDTNAMSDVFAFDIASGALSMVSKAAGSDRAGNASSDSPVLSTDGEWVAFRSAANDLVAGDTNRARDIFVRNLTTGSMSLVSRRSVDGGLANGASSRPQLSGSGGVVAFHSSATDLMSGDYNQTTDLFFARLGVEAGWIIPFNPPSVLTAKDSPLPLPPASERGRKLAYTVLSGPASIAGDRLELLGAGRVEVRVDELLDDGTVSLSVTRRIEVPRLNQSIAWDSPAADQLLLLNQPVPLLARASSGLPVTFRVQSGSAVISNGAVIVTNLGPIVLVAEQAGDAFNFRQAATRIHNRTKIVGAELVSEWPGFPRGEASAVQVVGNLAYVAIRAGGLVIFDVSDPAAPKRLGGFDTTGEARGVQVVGNLAYVADHSAGLQVIDVSDPASPRRLGGFDTSGWANGVQVVGTLAYVADHHAGLQVIDVSDPAAPRRLGGFATSGFAQGVQVVGTLAYVADGSAGLQVIDVSDPAAPVRLGGYETSGTASSVQVVGTLAYVADHHAGLQVIDVSDPAAPRRLGGFDTSGDARDVQVVGTLAYVADQGAGLQVIDVSDPAAPRRLGGFDTSGAALGVQVVGSRAYVADGDAGLQVIDVSDPAAPKRLGGFGTSGDTRSVQVVGTLAYVADGYAGLQVIDVSDPSAPRHVGGWDTSGYAYGVQVEGNLAYVADGEWSLQVWRMRLGVEQTIFLDLPTLLTRASSPLPLVATSSSGLPVVFRVVSGPAEVSGSQLNLTGPGTVVLRAEQSGDSQILPATVERTIRVILSEPVVTQGPVGQSVAEGTGLIFSVAATGEGPLRYQWSLNGVALVQATNATLRLPATTLSDAGNYTVEVSNAFGRVISAPAILRVLRTQTIAWTSPAAGQLLRLNQPVPLVAQASSGLPVVFRVQSGSAVISDGMVTVTNLGSVVLVAEQAGDTTNATQTLTRTFNPTTFLGADPLGQWPEIVRGEAQAVQVVGDLAYLAIGAGGLLIFDISNPAAPVRLGGLDTSGFAIGVQVVGNLAYVADNDAGLQILDVSNPAAPVRRGGFDTSGYARGVQVVGNLAYVADGGSGLQILDVSNPAAPVRRGGFDTSSYARGVQVVGNLAYVADSGSGLQILDVSNPAAPVRLGGYDTSGYAYGVQVVGSLAYIADDVAGLQILDVSTPAAPVRLGGYDTGGNAVGVQVVGSLAYVADGYSGLQILDVSKPAAPESRGGYDTSGYASSVQVVGNLAYVADGYNGLQILDVKNLAAPMPRGGYKVSGFANDVHRVGNLAYVADSGSGLQILDVSNPAAPVRLGGFDTSGWASGVQVVGNLAYVANGYSGLLILDVSNPAAPVRRGGFDTSGFAYGVRVAGNLAYIADYDAGLQILDVSNPAAPVRRGGFDTSGFARGVQVMGNLAFVADGGSGLQILDVSNPTAPVRLGGYDTDGWAVAVQVVGSLAYVADGAGLQILDVSNPVAPLLRGGYRTSGYAYGVQVLRNLAYVADGSAGLQVIDVSDPAAPVRLGGYETSGTAPSVQVEGNLAYVADGEWGLQVLRLRSGVAQALAFDPPAPVTLAASPVRLVATANSGLPVSFTVVSGPATLAGALLTLTGEGTVVVRAVQGGDEQFLPAPPVQREITVLATPTPLRLSEVSMVPEGRLRFRMEGPTGGRVILQFSPDLRAWIAVSTNTVPVTVEPPPVSDSGPGFYRAVLQ
jgi:Tol biopolymer transport system component